MHKDNMTIIDYDGIILTIQDEKGRNRYAVERYVKGSLSGDWEVKDSKADAMKFYRRSRGQSVRQAENRGYARGLKKGADDGFDDTILKLARLHEQEGVDLNRQIPFAAKIINERLGREIAQEA